MSQNNFGFGSGNSTPGSPWNGSGNTTPASSQFRARTAQSPQQAAPTGTTSQAQGNTTLNATFGSTTLSPFQPPTHSPRGYAPGNSQANSQTSGSGNFGSPMSTASIGSPMSTASFGSRMTTSSSGLAMPFGNFGSPSTTSVPGSPPYTPSSPRSSESDYGSNFGSPRAPRNPRDNAVWDGSDMSGITHAQIAQHQLGLGMGSIAERMTPKTPSASNGIPGYGTPGGYGTPVYDSSGYGSPASTHSEQWPLERDAGR